MTPERLAEIRAALAAWDACDEGGPVAPAAVLWADGGGQAVEDLREVLAEVERLTKDRAAVLAELRRRAGDYSDRPGWTDRFDEGVRAGHRVASAAAAAMIERGGR